MLMIGAILGVAELVTAGGCAVKMPCMVSNIALLHLFTAMIHFRLREMEETL